MGAFVGPGNALGTPIPVDEAERHVFGLCLVNDWSARDVQRWEYVPLGPFLAKNFLTTISPWIVSLEALAPVRVDAPPQEGAVLPYLREARRTTFDVTLEAHLKTAALEAPVRIARTNYRYLYWTLAQQIAHHTSGGCNLRAGDLLASGTISGPDEDSYGSLLELAWKGTKPLALPSGETRSWLEDGDTLTLTGYATLPDGRRLGFGEATGTVEAA
jgi:fumarylacetoacetase